MHLPKKRTRYDELPNIPARNIASSHIVKDIFFEQQKPFDLNLYKDSAPSIPKRYTTSDMSTSVSYQIFDLLQDLPDHNFEPTTAPSLPSVRPAGNPQGRPDADGNGNGQQLQNRRRVNWPQLVGRRDLPLRNCRSNHMRNRTAAANYSILLNDELLQSIDDSTKILDIPQVYKEFALSATEIGEYTIDLDRSDLTPMTQAFVVHYQDRANEYALMAEQVMQIQKIPRTFWQAVRDPNSGTYWQQAAKKEIKGWIENKSYEIVELPLHGYAINYRWLFSIKYGPDGRLLKHKARVVVRGDTQREGLDYAETFAPVGKMASFRLLFAHALQEGREIHHLDVSTAFLAAPLDEEIYMQIPPGFPHLPADDPPPIQLQSLPDRGPNGRPMVMRLLKAAYGLKQAPHQWKMTFDSWAYEIGYRRAATDHSVYIHKDGSLMIIWVDDILVIDKRKEKIAAVKASLGSRFNITDLGLISHYLNLNLLRGTNEEGKEYIFIHQEHFIDQILKDHGMDKCNAKETPMTIGPHHNEESPDLTLTEKKQYISLIGSLNYIVHTYRPDIAYAVNYFSRYSNKPKQHHMKGAKRILAYLKGTKDYGLYYEHRKEEELGPADLDGFSVQWKDVPVTGFGDSDFANGEDRKSITGYCFFYRGNLVSWASKKQTTVATSTVHVEYVAASLATREACWLRSFLCEITNPNVEDFSEEVDSKPVLLYTDSHGAQAIAANPVHHQRTKHFDIHHHFIRERIAMKHISLQTCSTSQQIADIFTKPLSPKLFHQCRIRLGLRPLNLPDVQKEQWRHRF